MIVRIWLVLALICLLAGLIAQYTFRLKEPLFLHYSQSAYLGCGLDGVETSDVWYTQVNFAYLTDVTDEICVREIRFSELPELQMQEMREKSSQRDSMRFIAWMLRFRLKIRSITGSVSGES